VSAIPVDARYASAFFAMLRGSRLYCSPVIGSWMKKLMFSVLSRRKGSTRAVARSARSAMSDSWIAWKPRMDDPSNASSSVGSNDFAGTVKCCITPGRSQKRTSTNLTSSSEMNFLASSAFWNIQLLLLPLRGGAGA
jgi:hypothetical protein